MITVLSCRGQIIILHADEINKQIKEDWKVKLHLKSGGTVKGTFYKSEEDAIYLRQDERLYRQDLDGVKYIEYKIGGDFERDASFVTLLIMMFTIWAER